MSSFFGGPSDEEKRASYLARDEAVKVADYKEEIRQDTLLTVDEKNTILTEGGEDGRKLVTARKNIEDKKALKIADTQAAAVKTRELLLATQSSRQATQGGANYYATVPGVQITQGNPLMAAKAISNAGKGK